MCEIIVVNNHEEANLITHGGRFHADDVFATVIMMKYLGTAKVYRAIELPKVKNNVIVYDIGWGAYDHHQKGGNGVRYNGVPYASAGLVWKEFGRAILNSSCDPYFVWKNIDKKIIQGVDAIDNYVMPRADYPIQPMSISKVISLFNPTWTSDESEDEAFIKAVRFAEVIFDNMVKSAESKAKARKIVGEAIENSSKHIMILNPFVPWQDFLFNSDNPKAKDIHFVVFPSDRGGYNWVCISKEFNRYENRKDVPKEWCGCTSEELQKLTGIATAKFCHVDGFIGGAETLEDTIKMVELAYAK